MSQYDTHSLYDFLVHTPEGGLRKILVDKKNMTDVHCTMLIKIAKSCPADQFAEHFDKQDFPRLRFGPAELKLKEKFWEQCTATLLDRGVLQPLPSGGQKIAA